MTNKEAKSFFEETKDLNGHCASPPSPLPPLFFFSLPHNFIFFLSKTYILSYLIGRFFLFWSAFFFRHFPFFLVCFLCVCLCFVCVLQAISLVLDEARVEIARLMAQLSLSDKSKPFPFHFFP
jgi:hypothetical protein